MLSGDRSVTPATLGASGNSDLQRVPLSASGRKRSGPERLATSKNMLRTARSAVSCRLSASGHQTSSSDNNRGQSREVGSLSTLSGSVKASAKYISMGPAHCRERVQDSVRISSASIQRGISHSGGPRAGSGNGTRSRYSLEEGGHRGGPSSRQRFRVLQPLLHRSERKDGGLRPILDLRLHNRSVMRLNFKMLTIKQVVSQIRSEDWFVTIDLKDAYFHISIRKVYFLQYRGPLIWVWCGIRSRCRRVYPLLITSRSS